MTTPEDQIPRNVQNVAEGAAAYQFNKPQAPVIVGGTGNQYNFNYGVTPPVTPVASGVPHNLPYSGAIALIGREDDLQRLHEQLEQRATVAISSISGMGGIGKTELAWHYANQQLASEQSPAAVCWLKAREELGTQIIGFAQGKLGLTLQPDIEFAAKVEFCWEHLRQSEALVIFDDVQQFDDVRSLLAPVPSRFKVLLTTRQKFRGPVQDFEIQVLTEDQSLELLRAIASPARIDGDLETAKQICEWLGYLPLGLELVGRFLARKSDLTVAMLWERLQAKRLDAIALKQAAPEMTAQLGVAAAFELSWQELDLQAQRVAAFLSLFALAEFQWEWVQAALPEEDEEELEEVRDRQLVDFSLLTRTGQGMYELHQLLREFFAVKRSQMLEDEVMKRSFCAAMVAIADQIPQTVTLEIIERFTAAIPHLKEAATTLSSWLSDADSIAPSTQLAWFYQGQAAYAEALIWKKHCLRSVENRLGSNHLHVAAALNSLAELYREQGQYTEAEPLYRESLQIREEQLGQNHFDVASSLNNLGLLYVAQERYREAEPLYKKALAIWTQQLGSNHSCVATALNNLAGLYRSEERYREAEPLYKKALAIWTQQLGSNHSCVATALNNLAGLYQLQGCYREAESLYMEALAIREQQLGSDHPYLATSLNDLAILYDLQEDYRKAEPLYRQSLAIWEKSLGSDHPAVSDSLNNLAALYHSQRCYSDAEPLYLRAISISYQHLGETHSKTQTFLENFVLFLQKVIQDHRTTELSDDPMTRSLLKQLQPMKPKHQARGFGKRSQS
ncbi:MAG: tetratricopeptide repeat protein [Phormidium tanganyikae FI6-MK23]|jgi:tetratricopeptide (TPR) repeat protein|nr:tetratricopeptide repeat protein [Phormidium tanganyikae FI6-MK23]